MVGPSARRFVREQGWMTMTVPDGCRWLPCQARHNIGPSGQPEDTNTPYGHRRMAAARVAITGTPAAGWHLLA